MVVVCKGLIVSCSMLWSVIYLFSDVFSSLCSGVSHYWVVYLQVPLVLTVLMTLSGCC